MLLFSLIFVAVKTKTHYKEHDYKEKDFSSQSFCW